MPQCRNWRVSADYVSTGKGSLSNSLVDVSVATRRRAQVLNSLEVEKLSIWSQRLEKQNQSILKEQQRLMNRLNHGLTETQAYKHVIDSAFKAQHFDTLKWGYKLKDAQSDPDRRQRYAYETKIYHSGFTKKNLKRPLRQKLATLDPEHVKKENRAKKIEAAKEEKIFEVDRTARSLTVILNDFKEHKQSHKLPALRSHTSSDSQSHKPQTFPPSMHKNSYQNRLSEIGEDPLE